ncbi:MAG: hypothetical protein WCG06_04730, partial [Candidatus Omnitrophota bacterium]
LNYLSAPPVKKPAAPDIKSAFFDQLRRFPAVWITVDRALKSPLRRYLRSRLDDAKTDLAVFLEKDFTALRGGTKLDAEKNRLETFRVLQTFNEFLWSGKIVRLRDSSGLSYYRVADSVNADERERVAKVLLTYRESLLHLRNESATPSSEPLNIKKIVEDAGGCKEALQKRGIDFVLLPVPDRANYFVGRGIRVYAPADPFGPLFASLKEAGITAVNLPETYARAHQYNVELFQPDDSHWSRKGVAIAAKGIANILEQA